MVKYLQAADMTEKVDLLITNTKTVHQDHPATPLWDVAIAVKNGCIAAIGTCEEIVAGYEAGQTWDAGGKVVLPGFINTHNHLFQTFMRGLGKDAPFMEWMAHSVQLIMPHLDDESIYLAAMMGCLEAIRTGTTTMVDFMYANIRPCLADAVVQAFEDSGIRGVLARGMTDVDRFPASPKRPASWEPVKESLADIDRLVSKYRNRPRLSFIAAPSVIWAMTRQGLAAAAEYAKAHNMVLTMHLLETPDDDKFCLEQYGMRTTAFLEEIGVLEADFLAVHTVQVQPEDMERFERFDVRISHNPVANMILGTGVAPVCEFVRHGICVSLGTDGAASNDSQNLLEVMKTAALLQKVHTRDTAALSANEVFSMATLQGAAALSMEDQIGSLEPGKRADFILVDYEKSNTTPCYEPVASLVYSGSEGNLAAVFVEGRLVYETGRFTHLDEAAIVRRAQDKALRLYRSVRGL